MSTDAGQIEVIARGILLRSSQVLLCSSVKGGYLYLPGGHVEPGESCVEALEREIMEETGLRVVVGPCLLVAEVRFDDGRQKHHELNIVFHVEHCAGPLPAEVESRESGIGFAWRDLSSLVDLDVRPGAIQAWMTSSDFSISPNRPTWLSIEEHP